MPAAESAAMPADRKPPNLKGFFCPNCRGVRLGVTHCRRACPGKVVRYRRCSACGHKVITEEVVTSRRKPKPGKACQS